MVTGKMQMVGNLRSHAENKTKRVFRPNVQDTTLFSEVLNRSVAIKVSAAGLRTIDHKGGLDAFVLSMAPTKLSPELQKLRKQIDKAQAKKAA
jgi:large subunit ribosomal protein L28